MTWPGMPDAELYDTRQHARAQRTKQPCRYCGTKTTALSRVCPSCSDLPSGDPHVNVRAGKYQRVTP